MHTHTGPLKANEARVYDCARVQFSGEVQDTFFGAYASDLKSGPGLYCFASGAFYAGEFKVRGSVLLCIRCFVTGEFKVVGDTLLCVRCFLCWRV